MKAILYFVLFLVVYQALRSLFRAPGPGTRTEGPRAPRIPGEEMVLDPQCRTYVVKGRALARRVNGQTQYFCSEACADAHERGSR